MTTIFVHNELDHELCERARQLGHHNTQAEVIHKALEIYRYYLQSQYRFATTGDFRGVWSNRL